MEWTIPFGRRWLRIWNIACRKVYVWGTRRNARGGRNTMHYYYYLTFVFVRAVSLLPAKRVSWVDADQREILISWKYLNLFINALCFFRTIMNHEFAKRLLTVYTLSFITTVTNMFQQGIGKPNNSRDGRHREVVYVHRYINPNKHILLCRTVKGQR